MNVLFVCVDCLREDFVGDDRADTPFIDSLISEGLHYTNMFSTTSTTTPCVASIFTGLYSERNGVNSHQEVSLNPDVKTLAEVLGEEGYGTYALATGPIVEETELDRGFDEYWYRDRNENLIDEWFDEAVERLQGLEEPFFLYMHLWELHRPIEVPAEFDSEEYGEWPYARALSAVDRALEDFVSHLSEDTLIVLHGDHGESISWRHNPFRIIMKLGRDALQYYAGIDMRPIKGFLNRFFHQDDQELKDHFIEDGHGETVYDFNTNVPLVLHHGSIESREVSVQCRQVDVFPTLLDVLEIDVPEGLDGETLLPPGDVEDRDVYMRACGTSLRRRRNWSRAVRSGGMKYITYPERPWGSELYDLEKDSFELRPVNDPEKAEMMEKKLPSEELRELDKIDIEDRLKELGYL